MNVREKILILCGAALVGTAGVLYFASSRVFIRSFERLEQRALAESVDQACRGLDEMVNALDMTCGDWATWNDSYEFIENPGQRYKSANLNNGSLAGIRLNLIAYVNPRGDAVFETGFDFETSRFLPYPDHARPALGGQGDALKRCLQGETVKGILLLPEGPMVVSARPILTSQGEGPVRGMLVMGRWLNQPEVVRLRHLTGQSLELFPATAAPDMADAQPPGGSPDGAAGIRQRISHQVITGFAEISDITGQPGVVIEVNLPRDAMTEGYRMLVAHLFILIVCGSFATMAVLVLFNRVVMRRLLRLQDELHHLGRAGELSNRVTVDGDDELADVARSINGMLESFDATHTRAGDRPDA